MVKSLSVMTIPVHATKSLSFNKYGKGSQTRATSARTSQAYGDGKGVPLTDDAEGEEIVEAL